LYFRARRSRAFEERFLKSSIQPSAHGEWHFKGLNIDNNLQCFSRGVKDNATSPAPRDVIFKSPPDFSRTLLIDIVREMGQHFFAT
jgi:hypothetical protein